MTNCSIIEIAAIAILANIGFFTFLQFMRILGFPLLNELGRFLRRKFPALDRIYQNRKK